MRVVLRNGGSQGNTKNAREMRARCAMLFCLVTAFKAVDDFVDTAKGVIVYKSPSPFRDPFKRFTVTSARRSWLCASESERPQQELMRIPIQ